MFMAIHSKHKKLLLIIFLFILLGGLAYLLYSAKEAEAPTEPAVTERYRATLTGTYVCLPHKDTSGPQTLECAFGIKTDEGDYYALDLSMVSQEVPNLTTGTRLRATGTVTPIEMLSTDQWQKYPIKGIFSVVDSLQEL